MRQSHLKIYTLIELLISISIIMMLAALLLPTLRAAKENAKSVFCKGNQKQIGVCFLQYYGDYNGYVLKASRQYNTWSEACVDYASDIKVFFCPSQPPAPKQGDTLSSYWDDPSTGSVTLKTCTYGIWYAAKDKYELQITDPVKDTFLLLLKTIPNPSSYLYLSDTRRDGSESQVFRFAKSAPSFGVNPRHLNKTNSLLMDGHVDGYDMRKLKTTNLYNNCYVYYSGAIMLLY